MADRDVWAASERQRELRDRTNENASRLAFAFATYNSHGWGEKRFTQCAEFGLTFVEKPFVSYGCEIDGDKLIDTRFPRSSGVVFEWRRDTKDFYTGAWVAVTVDTKSPFIFTALADPAYDLIHHFTFAGIAYKALPDYLARS